MSCFAPRIGMLISVLASCALAGTIRGNVVEDRSGSALASAEIQILRAGGSGVLADLESDSNGRFELSDLLPGDYRIDISKPNYTSTSLDLHLTDALSPLAFVARLVRRGVISGQVLDAQGQPVRGATVFAMTRPAADRPWRRFARFDPGHQAHVDESGNYRLYDLPPGRYAIAVTYGASTVTVGSTGGAKVEAAGSGVLFYPANSQPHIFTVSGGEEYHDVNFSIAPGALYRVSGKVDLPTPESGFWLALTSLDRPTFATAVTQADADGTFHFQGIPPGSYTLFASGPAHARGPAGATLDEHPLFGRMQVELGADMDDISIPVEEGRSASFVLRNSAQRDQSCPCSLKLRLSSLEDWGADLDRTVTIDFTKPLRVDHLAPGRYLVAPQDSGANCCCARDSVIDLTAANAASPIAVLATPKGSLHVRLSVDQTQASKFVIVLLQADSTEGGQTVQVSFADSNAQFTFKELRPGHYRIAARPASADSTAPWIAEFSRMQEIEVQPGATIDLNLPIPESAVNNRKQ